MSAVAAAACRPRALRRASVRASVAVVATPADDPGESDGALARAVAANAGADTRSAEARVYARFARRVYLYGLRHLRDETRAEDLVQTVMSVVIQRLRAGDVENPDALGSFVLGTARLCAHDDRRRASRRAELATRLTDELDPTVAPREPMRDEDLEGCLAALSERERAVAVLSFHHDQDAAEIGAALGLSPGNVRVIRHRALARLARCMGASGEGA